MILISKKIMPKGYQGITLYPFMILRDAKLKSNAVVMNHERIHLKQQKELLIIPFYLLYGFEFLIRLFQYKNWNTAYRNISFEREAYSNEKKLNYLKLRPPFSFRKYL
ncbi:hypothetical protein ACJOV8_002325 [Formosa sp. 3Alg 14/1]|uniref:hypothetical protein n=1 Tax=Formosa sp. 3Alg 14/1 TaxID=3382190 RepID=UPI0039BEB2E6